MTLKIKNLNFSYKKESVLKNINLELDYGELSFIIGKNGSGKSTLFKCILSILNEYFGNIYIDDKNIKDMNIRQRASKISYVPQESNSLFNYTVEEIILMGTKANEIFKNPGNGDILKVKETLEKLNIKNLRYKNYLELSGGQRQLVLIARALVQGSKIIIMDEPTANLDFINQLYIMKCVKKLTEEGYLIFLSTHNPDYVFRYADKVVALKEGTVFAFGNTEEIMTEEILTQIYGYKIFVKTIDGTKEKVCIAE